jgi:enoyl-CoA hydratase/carnithine racemase
MPPKDCTCPPKPSLTSGPPASEARPNLVHAAAADHPLQVRTAHPARPKDPDMKLRRRHTPSFFTAYESLSVTRSPTGVLTVRMHTNGGPATISDAGRDEFSRLLDDIAQDSDSVAVIITGTGEEFTAGAAPSATPTIAARRIPTQLGELDIPSIAAVNGPVRACCEYALLADIVIASQTAEFSGLADAAAGLTGAPTLNGPRLRERSAYYALASGSVSAQDAHRCGVVAETHPPPRVLPRARELAETLAARPEVISSYVRDVIRQDADASSTGSTPISAAFGRLTLVDPEHPAR